MTPDERAALLRKYRRLAGWRVARDAGAGAAHAPATRAELRALSAEFPGCLRELDLLGAAELDRRVEALDAAAPREPPADWMLWIATYHRLMRAALTARRSMHRAERAEALPASRLAHLRQLAAAVSGESIDDAFIQGVAAPPGGRLSPMVLGLLAQRFGTPAAHISFTLFPPRRPPPYGYP